ncbi:MAG: carboxypeptidase-like regulatory domain-containing protein [Flavobacteriales bacterium]|nr:carboxypeptidase-like regulatory domain-containing protein [Flavobacteriales bacterium]
MTKNLFALLVIIFSLFSIAHAQQGSIKGKILDTETGEPLPFVNVSIEQGGNLITGASTDFDGVYVVKSLSPGKYDVKVKFVGYKPMMRTDVVVNSDKITFLDIKMETTAVEMEAFIVEGYKVPLISKDNTTSGGTMTSEEIDRMATRSAAGVASQIGGVYTSSDGDLNVRGARSDANYYFVDGIKVRGGANLIPQSAIAEVSVMLGGVPAQYGDITGGIISITTKGAAREYGFNAEYVTSGYRFGDGKKYVGLDPYAYNLFEVSALGPILWSKDSANQKKDPILGFFVSANYQFDADQRPSHNGVWKLKDETLDNLRADPLRTHPTGSGTAHNGEFVRMNDLENTRLKPNNQRNAVSINGKLEIKTGKTTSLAVGGNYSRTDRNGSGSGFYSDGTGAANLYPNTLMNWNIMPKTVSQDYNGFARFTQRFNNQQGDENASVVKNAYYSVQFDYTNNNSKTYDPDHKDDLFKYGHIGYFKNYQAKNYAYGIDSATSQLGYIHQNWEDTLVGYTPGTANPDLAEYTTQYYKLFGWEGYDANGNPVFDKEKATDPTDPGRNNKYLSERGFMQTNGALLNGDEPRDIYGLYNAPGQRYNSNSKFTNNQYRLSANGAVDIGDHEIKLGFEYEQRVDRSYGVAPRGLWTRGRQLVNLHIKERDLSNPIVDSSDAFPGAPVYTYNRLNAAPGEYSPDDAQSFFDYNLRKNLTDLAPGGTDGTDYIDLDNIDPERLKLDYFSPDELLNQGNAIVSYYGYDAYGTKLKENVTLEDYFSGKDEFGNYTRQVGAFTPIYVAGYIQDKFAISDLIFNVGLRIDRYDANQKVLKDPYVFFPTVKAGESEALKLADGRHPENIGEDFVVYVDDVKDPSSIRGYRDGNIWYNAEGVEISNPDQIATSNGIAPLLVDKDRTRDRDLGIDGFEDYKPQTNFMPRIAFSFPISDEALFFAHYDVLTRRPPSSVNRLDPNDYYFLLTTNNQTLRNNPNLKAEKTVDYEIGFQQKLTNSSSLKIATFYREMRDQIQAIRRKQAYPRSYSTFENIDFGTVKGLTITYDLRRTGNVSFKGSYTLQFAEGTGSDATFASSLINAGKDNLRVTNPLNYDQRHTIQGVFDFRYSEGKHYNGPIIADKQILKNSGFNLTANLGSGVPYSGQVRSNGTGFKANQGSAFIEGSINGNRLPWSFRLDGRIDKDFTLKVGKEKNKNLDMTVYLQILNMLNSKNITSVYRYTGSPDDDGYLADPQWAKDIESQNDTQSFTELYNIKVANPNSYNIPRQTRIGVRVSF